MPSEKHQSLLRSVERFAGEHYQVREPRWIVRRDASHSEPPPSLGRYRPDFYALREGEGKDYATHIVGEAKTAQDLGTARSQRQIAAYIHCLLSRARLGVKSVLILAVPITSIGFARRVVQATCRTEEIPASFRWHVIEQTGWEGPLKTRQH